MSIKETLKRLFSKQDIEGIADSTIDAVKEKIAKEDVTPEMTAEIAFEQYQKAIKQIPREERGKFVEVFTKSLIQKPGIPYEVAQEYIIKASNEAGVDNARLVESAGKLPDKKIVEILSSKQSALSFRERFKLAEEGIANPKLQSKTLEEMSKEESQREEKKIKKELEDIYTSCDRKPTEQLVGELENIKNRRRGKEIHNKIKEILARKAAIEWKVSGVTRLSRMAGIISADEIMEGDFIDLVGKEFEEVKNKREYPGEIKEFKPEQLERQVLAEIAKRIPETYEKYGYIDIPEYERMKKLQEREDQEEFFITEIQRCGGQSGKGVPPAYKIKDKIRGMQTDSLETLKRLVEMIPEEQRDGYIRGLKIKLENGTQETLNLEVAEKLEKIRNYLVELDPDDAIAVLQKTEKEIQQNYQQQPQQKEGSTQSDDGEMLHLNF